ncbi:MAG: transposase [Acidobacteriaceae bacterium]
MDARPRRAVVKGENPRFVVTSTTPDQWAARELYEQFYCQRVEMENRIKDADAPVRLSPLNRGDEGQSVPAALVGAGVYAG